MSEAENNKARTIKGRIMNYNNYPYSIFNQSSLLNYGQLNINGLEQHQAEQQKNILEMRKAIRDYCEAA